ncbi:hypothetical protein [Pseudarthrobacter scleromae]|uniref:hypothetical protein n=1 Tax=Pseudarthrobacter scleromae TaxID=158897 RepID=UPI003D05E25C
MDTENVTEGSFVWWLAKQDRRSVAGRLSLRLFEDLAAARLPRVPTSLHEVKEWAATTRRKDAEVQQLLPVAVRYWKQWVRVTPIAALDLEVAK